MVEYNQVLTEPFDLPGKLGEFTMPIYEYECLTCGVIFEKRQSFNDEPKANCPNGHAETRRLLAAPAIVFKGSGFYINDSKASKSSANGTSAKSEKTESSSESKSDSKTETKSESSSSESSPVKAEA
jgi:putative FmdB family regulatory protein